MTENIVYHSEEPGDLDYIRGVSEIVYAGYDGRGQQWQLTDSDGLWKISLGGRAGVLGVKLRDRVSCVKLYYDGQLRSKLRTLLGFSKGRRAFYNGMRLKQVGIGCPRMLGYAERRPTGPAMVITELISDGIRLDHWMPQQGMQREMVRALARYIRDMHDRGVFHLDLSPRNLLIQPFAGGGYKFFLLDYEDARFTRKVRRRTRLNNLHHLHERVMEFIPLRARVRFLRAYAREDYPAWRDALYRLMRHTGK